MTYIVIILWYDENTCYLVILVQYYGNILIMTIFMHWTGTVKLRKPVREFYVCFFEKIY